MLYTASLTLLALITSAGLAVSGVGSPLAVAHLAFAVGVVPLIFAAISHFVPVLTRTGNPSLLIRRLPPLAQGAGLLVVAAMQGLIPYGLLHLAATVDIVLAIILLRWIFGRTKSTLGSPHPGWRWYGAAIVCLILALTAVLLMSVFPDNWRALRSFHLHLNSIGLVGLAALGTLPVLLPTAMSKPDPEAAGWLRRRLWIVAGGAVMLAMGTAIRWEFATPGAALVMVVALGLIGHWGRRFGFRQLFVDGVTTSLTLAVIGLVLALASGVAHGAGFISARASLLAWGVGFLLPLITGTLSQLLPVWRWPGPIIPARPIMRQKLAATGSLRACLWLFAALAIFAEFQVLAAVLLVLGLFLFVIGLVQAMRVTRSTR